VGFRLLRESIDTTAAGGRLVFHLFGALAQFEREIIRDRTVEGLSAARARGRVGGRPSELSAEQRRQARKMYDERELTVEQIGTVLSVSRTSIYRALGPTAAPGPQIASTSRPSAPRRTSSATPEPGPARPGRCASPRQSNLNTGCGGHRVVLLQGDGARSSEGSSSGRLLRPHDTHADEDVAHHVS